MLPTLFSSKWGKKYSRNCYRREFISEFPYSQWKKREPEWPFSIQTLDPVVKLFSVFLSSSPSYSVFQATIPSREVARKKYFWIMKEKSFFKFHANATSGVVIFRICTNKLGQIRKTFWIVFGGWLSRSLRALTAVSLLVCHALFSFTHWAGKTFVPLDVISLCWCIWCGVWCAPRESCSKMYVWKK